MSEKPFYITTAIDYPNGKPHIGHLYEKIIADTYKRYYEKKGRCAFLATGTDENGQKLLKAAEASGIKTQEYVDENVKAFKKAL